MRRIQYIFCTANSYGGGLDFYPKQQTLPSNNHFCYFIFFLDCRCTNTTPYGHDVYFEDYYKVSNSSNPFYESYTTNTNDKRICYVYLFEDTWIYQQTQKKWWLNEGLKDRIVGTNGSDSNLYCGISESAPCKTVGHAVGSSIAQLSSTITVLGGKHVSEGSTISVGEKKIIITGKGNTVSVVGTSSLSSSSTTLFSISTGQLEVGHMGIDHNSTRSSSPSVFMVSLGSGTLSLEDVLIDSSKSGGSGMTKCVFEVALTQRKMIDVEIKTMKVSQSLFSEPSSGEVESEESFLSNVTIRNVNLTEGDGVVMAKSVMEGETFVVWNTTMEGCECANGNGGGIYVGLKGNGKVVVNGTSVIDGNKADNN
ncbi:uncharacterized protein MONOS_10013 [Monocercomonoides exilis]|uniref:uncharacterized protein n=1 Tax=Monocercomonoides exilis TaxID=2049356 RepID=UPI00355A3AD2|nr:hypothetical protein MONOS_10013 [Monocercomonoides exilis]|eukprot:MONOS_10013.1-p1 / transcript=MONOS_10013.1 / gene=MONOS_10013 / organism=Monocercomonoides_exilis_PA203 / gene_product=unspecified product / transcript_product=unspecified product / location=Mono_scaffold00437:16901-18001(+) / protein_length=367 / sequence_SO=supercontig / SO=protein_coding / is_pseudo=false